MNLYSFDGMLKLREKLIEAGVHQRKDNVEKWIDVFRESFIKHPNGEQIVEALLEAGFKDARAVERILENRKADAEEAIELKRELMALGIREEEAEKLVGDIIFYGLGKEAIIEARKREYELSKTIYLLFHLKDIGALDELVYKLTKDGVFSEQEALEELHFLFSQLKLSEDKPAKDEALDLFRKARRKGFYTTAPLFFDKDLNSYRKELYQRIDFYQKLGFTRARAEWWAFAEAKHGQRMDKVFIKRATLRGANNPTRIEQAVRLKKEFGSEILSSVLTAIYSLDPDRGVELARLVYREGIPFAKIIKLYETVDVFDPDNWTLIKKSEPEDFLELLKETLGDAKELAQWIKLVDVENISEFLKMGIRDYRTYLTLTTSFETKENIKEVLEYYSLHEILQELNKSKNERARARELLVEARAKYAKDTAVGKLRIRL